MTNENPKNFIGLTGGIGAGKSTVSARFAALGAVVLDADAVSRQALEPEGCCYDAVLSLFGREIALADGRIDRRRVAGIVFSDAAMLQRLNAIVHPAVGRELLRQASAVPAHVLALFDVPLLFESGWHRMVHKTIVVAAEDAVRVARICARDGCTAEEALARIRNQMPQQQKCRMADYILVNDGTVENLYRSVDALYKTLYAELLRAEPSEVCP